MASPAVEAISTQHSIRVTDSDGKTRSLRCDFLVTLKDDHRVMIELDGNHHFGPFSYGGSDDDLDARFRDQVKRDLCKNLYALREGFSLLRVSYLEYSHLERVWGEFLLQYNRNGRTIMASNADLYNTLKKTGLQLGVK